MIKTFEDHMYLEFLLLSCIFLFLKEYYLNEKEMYLVFDNRDFLGLQVFTAAAFTFYVNEEVIFLQIHDSIYSLIQIDKISFCFLLAHL